MGKMKNKNDKYILPIIALIIGVSLFLVFLIYDLFKAEPVNTNEIEINNTIDKEQEMEEMLNDLFEEVDTNVEGLDELEEDVEEEENTYEANTSDVEDSATSKEEKAVNLTKVEYGTTQNVYYTNEGIDNSGRYIVIVRDTATTKLLMTYFVNVTTGVVYTN